MPRISGYQLFVLTLSFQIGTTIIFGFASSAGRDCWIASLLSAGAGVLLILMYIAIYRLNPGLTLVEWFPAQFGKILGTPI
ncbi:MAG TPA: GerAB/ArcD/ProY family transporter, partial [Ruminiclostridium sp.]|nr:GerAB/ArcD/ProY family transporter [Ruminiclostridium sp.]